MLRRRILVNLGVFALIAGFFVYWAVTNLVSVDFIERPYRVTADFDNAMGVLPNAEVTYLGTQVGSVESVERIDGGVRLTLKINRGEEIPADVDADIYRKSALGEQYVDFSNPPDSGGDGPALDDGDHIPTERTRIPIEFADMLRAADELVSSIDPEDLSIVTHELAVGLVGRTDDLRSLIVEGERLADVFASRTDVLDRLATNNTRLTRVMAAHSDSLVSAVADLRAITEALDGVKDDVTPLVEEGSDLFAELLPVVRDHRDSLTCLFEAVDGVIDVSTTPARLDGLATLIEDMPTATQNLLKTLDVQEGPDGNLHQFIRLDLRDTAENAAEDYQPNRSTPPPQPDIAPCEVEFASTSEPGSGAPAPPSGPTPATGGALAATTALGLGLLAFVVHRLRPRTIERAT